MRCSIKEQNTKMTAGVLIACVLILMIRATDAVDYDDWDDSVPAEVLAQPVGIGIGGSEEKGAKLWPNRTGIPYVIDSSFSQENQTSIQLALRKIERSTGGCVMFKKRTNEKDYISFTSSLFSCGTTVGMEGGKQLVMLNDECTDVGSVQHEVMHVLGFYHEQSRPDRNDYIQLRDENILYSQTKQFQIEPLAHTFGTKYDYNSITHYSASAFSSSGGPTSVPKKGLIVRMGRKARLSPGDVAKIKLGYKCPLRIRSTSATQMEKLAEPFPNFSLEPMMYSQCKLQYNDYCSSGYVTKLSCQNSKALQINCIANATENILREMSTGMTEGALRAVEIAVPELILDKFNFAPLRRQVIHLQIRYCSTNRVTGRLIPLNLTNLLHLNVWDCSDLVVMKGDFVNTRKLRLVEFIDSIITTLQMDTFTDLPDLQMITLERIYGSTRSEYGMFDGPMQTYLYNLHCSCEFAWYRQWWRANKKLKLEVKSEELYSIAGAFGNNAHTKEDIYHPIDCKVSPFPLGTEWINYYTQTEYSVNEPNCETFHRCRNVLHALASDCN